MKPINKPKTGDIFYEVATPLMTLHLYAEDRKKAKEVFIKYLSLKKSKQGQISVKEI